MPSSQSRPARSPLPAASACAGINILTPGRASRRPSASPSHRLLNTSLTAIKQTSYVSIVGAWELTYAAREIVERTLASFQIFLGVMAIYFVICYPLAVLSRRLERRSSLSTEPHQTARPVDGRSCGAEKSFGELNVLDGVTFGVETSSPQSHPPAVSCDCRSTVQRSAARSTR